MVFKGVAGYITVSLFYIVGYCQLHTICAAFYRLWHFQFSSQSFWDGTCILVFKTGVLAGIIVLHEYGKPPGTARLFIWRLLQELIRVSLRRLGSMGPKRIQIIEGLLYPTLLPTICILLLMEIGKIFYGDFGMIYALVKDSGQLLPKVDVIDTYVFRMLRVTGDHRYPWRSGFTSRWLALSLYLFLTYC